MFTKCLNYRLEQTIDLVSSFASRQVIGLLLPCYSKLTSFSFRITSKAVTPCRGVLKSAVCSHNEVPHVIYYGNGLPYTSG